MKRTRLLLLVLCLAAAGCGGRDAADRAAPANSPSGGATTTTTAATTVEGAMCPEHGVLEAVCTRCRPKLIPVFKAKGDWCPEHEFPESICPICHPERGGKPAMDVDPGSEPPADGTMIVFRSREVAAQAGIETVRATAGEATVDVSATAVIRADAAKSARVNARIAGVAREIRADIGSMVPRGAVLAVLESADLAAIRSRLSAARGRLRTAEATWERERALFEQGIAAEKDVQAAEREVQDARAEVRVGQSALEMVGADDGASSTFSLRSPIAGTVTVRNISVGALVGENDILFEVVDVSKLWAEIDLPEREAAGIRLGQAVTIQVDGVEGDFSGTIDALSPVIDPATRTVRARTLIDNAAGRLRANMYARARVRGPAAGSSLLIPREAVQEARGAQLVFIKKDIDEFETRRVRVAPAGPELMAVLEGVRLGDDVVTTGSFLLKTETLKESIGAGCCDVEAPKK